MHANTLCKSMRSTSSTIQSPSRFYEYLTWGFLADHQHTPLQTFHPSKRHWLCVSRRSLGLRKKNPWPKSAWFADYIRTTILYVNTSAQPESVQTTINKRNKPTHRTSRKCKYLRLRGGAAPLHARHPASARETVITARRDNAEPCRKNKNAPCPRGHRLRPWPTEIWHESAALKPRSAAGSRSALKNGRYLRLPSPYMVPAFRKAQCARETGRAQPQAAEVSETRTAQCGSPTRKMINLYKPWEQNQKRMPLGSGLCV